MRCEAWLLAWACSGVIFFAGPHTDALAWRWRARWQGDGCIVEAITLPPPLMGQMRAIPPPSHSTRHTRARAVAREAPWRHNGEVRNTHHVLQALAQFSSFQGAWRQTAHWHVRGCVGKAVSPRRRVTQPRNMLYTLPSEPQPDRKHI